MKKRIIAILTLISILCSFAYSPAIFAQSTKYENPVLLPTRDTYIRYATTAVQEQAAILTVDPSVGNHRMAFIEFSLEDYRPHIANATRVYLSVTAGADAGNEAAGNKFMVIPLEDEYKDIDLTSLIYRDATEVLKDGVSLTEYMPDLAVYNATANGKINIDVTDYCKKLSDTKAMFMLKSVSGAYTFNSKETATAGSEPTLTIETEYTNILNDAVALASDMSQKYDGQRFSDDIPFETQAQGYNVSYESSDTEYITNDGQVLKRPLSNEENKTVSFKVYITHDDYPLINEFSEFKISLLKDGTDVASKVEATSDGADVYFDGYSASQGGCILSLDSNSFTHGGQYSIYTGNTLIQNFTADCTKSDVIIDISDYASGTAQVFSIKGELGADWKIMPVITALSASDLQAVMNLYNYSFGDLTNVISDLNLPQALTGYELSWASSRKDVLADNGRIERGEIDTTSVLTATLTGQNFVFEIKYTVNVIRENTDIENNLYPELADPMHTSDEVLFGKWDAADGSWSIEPLLRYDLFSELANIETAVRKGEYENAKSMLLSYYRSKSGKEILTFDPNTSYSINAAAVNDKIWGYNAGGNFYGETTIDTDWAWYSLDLSKNRSGAYWIMESDMDGTWIEIESKENPAGHSAYVDVVASGQRYIFPVVADTYISAGDNKDTNYGDEEILISREAAGDSRTPIGTNTARPYFKFDIPTFDSSTVSSVKLNIYARATGDSKKKVYVSNTANYYDFVEDEFVWSSQYPNAFCFKETGFIWPDRFDYQNEWGTEYEWINYSSRLYQTEWLLSRYLSVQNEEYAYRALELTMSQYAQQPDAIFPRNLEGGWRTENLISTMYTAINSEHMTPEIFTALLKWVYDHGNALKDQYAATANWNSAFKTNFARVCAFMPEIAGDGWWEKAKEDLKKHYSGTLLNPDGSYTESCTNYISGTIEEFVAALDIVAALEGGEDEYYIYFKDQLGKLLTYYTNLAYSSGKHPPYGDGSRHSHYSFIEESNQTVNDENVKWIVTRGAEGIEPDYTTAYYPDKGMVMFKSGWHEDDLCAFFNNDGGGSHGHYDDLALDVTAYGANLLVDAGVSSYGEGSAFAQVRHDTINHNTIQIDDTNQSALTRNAAGYTDLNTNGSFDYLKAASNDKMYDGFDVGRNVFMLKNKFLIVTDVIKPYDDAPHTYRQAWHPDINFNLKLDSETHLAYTTFPANPNVKIASVDTGEDAKIFERMMAGSANGETYSRSVQYFKENVTGNQTFDTVIYPDNTGFDTEVSTQRIELPGVPLEDATAFEIKINDNKGYFYSSNESDPPERTFGNYTYNGEMAYVETNDDGEVVYIAMTNGSKLSDGNAIVEFQTEVTDFSAKFESSSLKLYSKNGLPSAGVKIVSSKIYNTVYLNDKEVEFTYNSGYITTNGTPKSQNTPQGTLRPGSPSSGGSGFGGGTVIPPVVDPGTTDTPATGYPFADSENHWAKEYIEKLWSKGTISGVSETEFAPDRTITRAEFTKMIISACGIPLQGTDTTFSDVDSTMWYAPYVAAAYSSGFVSGYDDGSFKPDNPITRQEMAKMLCVACDIIKKYDGSNADIAFADNHLISDWAYLYVKKACGLGLFQGDSLNSFNPLNNATRAETATVICRMLGL